MRKILLSLTVILSFIFYSLHQRFEISDEAGKVTPPDISSSTTPVSTSTPVVSITPRVSSTPVVTSPPEPTSTPVQQVSGQYKNGEYTGDVTDAYYGNVQVKAVIKGGKIADVQFLQYPNDRQHSIEINTQAMPYLTQEAIQAQNANVDIISGATQTSLAFRQSLQSALDKGKI